jgi:hypothetical protein
MSVMLLLCCSADFLQLSCSQQWAAAPGAQYELGLIGSNRGTAQPAGVANFSSPVSVVSAGLFIYRVAAGAPQGQ